MTYDLTDSSPAEYPVIFENPADASVPPRWNAGATGQVKPGRCWKDRAVVVGFNDGSVRWMPLESGPDWVGLKEHVFPASINSSEPTRILQVAQ